VYKIKLSKKNQRFKYIAGYKESIMDNIVFDMDKGLGNYCTFDRNDWIEENTEEEVSNIHNLDSNIFETFELQDVESMIIFIMQKMKCDTYYPVKSKKARGILKIIIDEELFPGIEFNSDYTKIRNVSLVYLWLYPNHFYKCC
jgi:hypothetical protein